MNKSTKKLYDLEAQSRTALTADLVAFIEKRIKEPQPSSQLIAVLHSVQNHYGYLSEDKLAAVAHLMNVPAAKVSGVASFYHYFCLKPRGKHIIGVCMGTACYVKGADEVKNRLKEELRIEYGETTKDGLFTLEQTRCLGTCALAPVIKIGDDMHSQVTPDQVPKILKHYADQE